MCFTKPIGFVCLRRDAAIVVRFTIISQQQAHYHQDMKTHLPVALRKALLAGIVAVTSLVYNRAYAEDISLNTTLQNETVTADGQNVNISPADGAPAMKGGNTVTVTNGNITVNGDIGVTGGDGKNVLSVDGGNVAVNGDMISSDASLSATGDGDIALGRIKTTADKLTLTTEEGDISSSGIYTAVDDDGLETLTVKTEGGDFSVGTSDAKIFNANIEVKGNATIGSQEEQGSTTLVHIRGEGDTLIDVAGDLMVYQSLILGPGIDQAQDNLGGVGKSEVNVGGKAQFWGADTNITGGNNADSVLLTADTGIEFFNDTRTTITTNSVVTATTGNITILSDTAAVDISGDVYALQGNINIQSGSFLSSSLNGRANFGASGSITIATDKENYIINSDLVAGSEVSCSGAYVYMSQTNVDSTESVTVYGTLVKLYNSQVLSDEDIKITGGNVTVAGKIVDGDGLVQIAGDSSTEVSGVDVDGGSIVVGSGTGTTKINSQGNVHTTLNASGDIMVKDNAVVLEQGLVVSSELGNVEIAATGSDRSLSVTEGSVTTGKGTVAISGAAETNVSGVTVGASDGTDEDVSVLIGKPGEGATTVTDSAIDATKDVNIEGATVAVNGGTVNGDGAVRIAGSTSTDVRGADLNGGSISVGSGTGATTIASDDDKSTTLDASGDITVKDKAVTLEENSVITSAQGNIEIAAMDSDLSVTGGSVTTGHGTIAISGAASTNVNGAEVGIAEGSDAVVAVEIGLPGAGTTTIDGTTVNASGHVKVDGASVEIRNHSDIVSSGGDVTIAATGNNELSGDAVTATAGTVTVTSGATNTIAAAVTAGVDVEVTAGENNTITGDVTAGSAVEITAAGNNVLTGDAVTATTGTVTVTAGESNTIAVAVTSGTDVEVTAEVGNTISADVTAESGDVSLTAGTSNKVTGSATTVTTRNGAISLDAGDAGINQVNGATLDAQRSAAGGADDSAGTIAMTGSSNEIIKGASLQADAGVSISSTGTGPVNCNGISASSVTASAGDIAISAAKFNRVDDGSEIEAESGNVSIASAMNLVTDSTVTAGADVTMGAVEGSSAIAENVVASIKGEATIKAAGSVSIQGKNSIYRESKSPSEISIIAEQGDIDVSGSNLIVLASLQAGGAVRITTGEGDMATTVKNSSLTGSGVVIAGDITSRSDADLAEVSGADTLVEAKTITLNNVRVVDTGKDVSNIHAAEGGDISILDRVDLANATLTASGRIVVDTGHVLNARAASSLDGKLVGDGDINKSGGDILQLSGDNTGFNGSIYVNGAKGGAQGSVVDADNAGSWLEIAGAGVGSASAIMLKNTDLVVNSAEAQIGMLDTTQDAAANNAATGGTLLADGSYTSDDNTRTDFTTVGSVLEVQQGKSGDVLHASGMQLSDATLIKLDAEVGADGQASSDVISVSGSIDMAAVQTGNSVSPATAPVTARVFVNHLGDAASAAEGARTTIIEGTMASALNEDVLYEVTRSANGTYQRVLQERNVHLENKGDRVDLVYSKNYRSAAKNAQQTAVAGVLQQLSDNFHHSEGSLAASGDTSARLIDAFDYTRSEASAVRGLQSVAGSGNVLPRLMQFDSSRHHLADLRRQMVLPVCPRTDKGGVNRTRNTWITYTGAQNDLDGDAYMGDYSRTAHGFLLGADRSLTCNLRVGASLGYETSSSSADLAKVDGDTLFLDAYAVAVTGQLRHRVSFGLASSSFDSKRGVAVDAGYHSFSGQTNSSADGLTLNFGYELSTERQLNARSSLARYLAVNLSWHKLDAMREDGLGNMGLETSYDDEWQADVALGLQYNCEFTAVRHEAPATFYANAELHMDLLNDRLSARNRFLGTGADWDVKSMKRDSFYVEFGAGVIVPLSPSWTATAGAAIEVGSGHTSVSGNAGVRYTF